MTTFKKSNSRGNHKGLTIENETGRIVLETDVEKRQMYLASRTAAFVLTKAEVKKLITFLELITK